MTWQSPIIDVQHAHLRATRAERNGHWHLVVQHARYCFEQAEYANDRRAVRYFADKLSLAYKRMGMAEKAAYYRSFGTARST